MEDFFSILLEDSFAECISIQVFEHGLPFLGAAGARQPVNLRFHLGHLLAIEFIVGKGLGQGFLPFCLCIKWVARPQVGSNVFRILQSVVPMAETSSARP